MAIIYETVGSNGMAEGLVKFKIKLCTRITHRFISSTVRGEINHSSLLVINDQWTGPKCEAMAFTFLETIMVIYSCLLRLI